MSLQMDGKTSTVSLWFAAADEDENAGSDDDDADGGGDEDAVGAGV